MRSIACSLSVLMASTWAFALSGTVKDRKGSAIAGATLHLVSAPGKTTTTDAAGSFTLETSGARPRNPGTWNSGSLHIDHREGRAAVSIAWKEHPGRATLVSTAGRSLWSAAPTSREEGSWSYALPDLEPGVYLIHWKAAFPGAAPLIHTGSDWMAPAVSFPGWKGTESASPRQAATPDTLVARKTGLATVRTPIASYATAVEVVMDSATGAVRSAGCDKTRTLANGTRSLQSGGKTRKFILGVPTSYDQSKAYRLVVAYAESGSSAQSVANRNYFRMAGFDPKNTIFVAPDAENGAGTWSKTDVAFTDDILAQVEGDLCIDKSRIFATGFSFGGAMSIAIACTRADVFRGVAFFSGADLTGSCPTTLTKPIAYYASQASGDASGTPSPTSGRTKQAQFAAVNGCTADSKAIVFPAAGQAHTCTVYTNCKAGYPTVYCVFNGPHGWEPNDPGQSTSWNPAEAWKFITQF
ncbi:MAG TPA: hypothetical protein PKO15_01455 [Fibrobacteria bacterium]|nr:hypothetical protein [Fibrobacteria bacterium]HOX50476.1 hypothetical protein [Fibrobacteria bacterium]